MNSKRILQLLMMIPFLQGCSNSTPSTPSNSPKGEYIFRRHDEKLVEIEPMKPVKRDPYPWDEGKDRKQSDNKL